MAALGSNRPVDESLKDLFGRETGVPEIEALLAQAADEWTISAALGQYLASIILKLNRRSVLEFGAGRSSLILATALDHAGGGRLTSVEHQPEYGRDYWAAVQRLTSVNARLCEQRLGLRATRHGLMHGYLRLAKCIQPRAPYDLVVIDAPPGHYTRDSPMYDIYPFLAEGALIVLDDADRQTERTAVRRWLDTFPGLRIAASDMTHGRGTVVLIHSGDKRRRFSARAVLGTVHDRWVGTVNRVRYR